MKPIYIKGKHGDIRIKPNHSYLILEDSPELSFEIFKKFLHKKGTTGLVISAYNPKIVIDKYKLKKIEKRIRFIWWVSYSHEGFSDSLPFQNIEKFRAIVRDYAKEHPKSVVLVHGADSLFNYVDERSAILVLHQLSELTSVTENSILLVPFNENAISKNLISRLSTKFEKIRAN